jgi:FG-GAP repeat/FG-GAP-like repeat
VAGAPRLLGRLAAGERDTPQRRLAKPLGADLDARPTNGKLRMRLAPSGRRIAGPAGEVANATIVRDIAQVTLTSSSAASILGAAGRSQRTLAPFAHRHSDARNVVRRHPRNQVETLNTLRAAALLSAALVTASACSNAHHRAAVHFRVQRVMHVVGTEGEEAGAAVSAAGDVNGDGLADVLVSSRASLYVVFGQRDMHALDLAHLGRGGYRIENKPCCSAVRPVLHDVVDIGDINGDGRDDLAVLWYPETTHLATQTMTTSIVLGKSDAATINLAAIGRRGFQIAIPFSTRDTVAPAGDLNGDGLADFALSAPFNTAGAGSVYVIFGNKHPRQADVGNLRDAGFTIEGANRDYELGTFLGTVGDLNQDGRSDLVVGFGEESGNAVWIVSGARDTGSARVDELGNRGFRASLRKSSDPVEIATAGDVDGDGHVDLLVGDEFAGADGSESGAADVYAFKPRR